MGPQLFFCSDSARRDPSGSRITRCEGWCVGLPEVRTLLLANDSGQEQRIPYGFVRADLAAAYPDHPNAQRGGFKFSADIAAAANEGIPLLVEVQAAGGSEWHRVAVNLDTRDIQTVPLTGESRVPPDQELSLTSRFDADATVEAHLRDSLAARRGLTLRLDIINKCNLRCVMCHFSDDAVFKRPTSQLTGEQFKALFDDIGPFVSQVMLSCGDEPLTSRFLPEILRYLATQHPQVAIEFCTNAMLMREPIRELIIETRVARLLFSVDAVTKPMLESIRVGCRYEQLLGNIIALRDLRAQHHSTSPAFVFNFVMMNQNIHEAPAFVGVAKELGAESIDFRHVVPIGTYFQEDELLTAHPAKYNYYREQIVAEASRLNVSYVLPPRLQTADAWTPGDETVADLSDFRRLIASTVPQKPLAAAASTAAVPVPIWEGSVAEEFSGTFCNRPFSEVMIRDQDEVLPCPWHGKTLGRLSEGKSLRDIFLGEDFAALRRNMLKPEGDPDCARCPIKTEHLPTSAN